jgi:hypothetical protein
MRRLLTFGLIHCAGGETPINNSIVLYQGLKEKHPEFIEEIEKKVRGVCLV